MNKYTIEEYKRFAFFNNHLKHLVSNTFSNKHCNISHDVLNSPIKKPRYYQHLLTKGTF